MNSSSDAAESMVKMTLEGTQVALRVTGSAAKNIGAILLAISKNKIKTRGKTTLNKMLKSGKELKVFSLKKDDLEKFVKEAKKYGVLYSVLVDKKQTKKDGLVDIIVRAEDAAKINRIFERFKFSSFEKATVQKESEKEKTKEEVKDDIHSTKGKEKQKSNPTKGESKKNPPSDISLKHSKEGTKKVKKPFVKKTLREIKKQFDSKDKINREKTELSQVNVKKNTTKKLKSKSKVR